MATISKNQHPPGEPIFVQNKVALSDLFKQMEQMLTEACKQRVRLNIYDIPPTNNQYMGKCSYCTIYRQNLRLISP